ncbi:MAG: PDZ domain-containing protein, partial [Phycisphaerae bacterium]
MSRLIGDLSDPRWAVRERASTELTELGPAAYGPLREAFHRDERYEVRRRVRRIVQDIYLFEAIQKRGGFLGIAYRPRTKSPEFRWIPDGHHWIDVQSVKRHSGAERAGLRSGDLIRSLNGQPLRIGELSFHDWIGKQPPRTRVRLG